MLNAYLRDLKVLFFMSLFQVKIIVHEEYSTTIVLKQFMRLLREELCTKYTATQKAQSYCCIQF